jgi:hypothetical protein
VIDASGTVYVSDLFALDSGSNQIPVSVSTNGGRSYVRTTNVAETGFFYDRQWQASAKPGQLVVVAQDGDNDVLVSWVTNDQARLFTGPFEIARGATSHGPLIAGPRGTYFMVFGSEEGLNIATTRDGIHWTKRLAAPGHAAVLFPVVAVDDASNIYVAWSDESNTVGTGPILLVRSIDGGRTWTPPIQLSARRADAFGTSPSAVFPWIVAGARGRVAVSYAIARTAGPDVSSNLGGPLTTWDMVVTQSMDATARKPRWSSVVAARAFHTGSICTFGIVCPGPQQFGVGNFPSPFDRRALDFNGMAADRDGRLYVVYTRDRPMTTGETEDVHRARTDVMIARQTSGPRMR